MTFIPVPNANDSAIITVTVNDGGMSNNIARPIFYDLSVARSTTTLHLLLIRFV
jgi:hypothetical protein